MQAVPIWLINKTWFTHSIYLTPSTWRFVLRVSFASTAPLEFFSPGFSMVVGGGKSSYEFSPTNKLAPVGILSNSWRVLGYCAVLWVRAASPVIGVRMRGSLFWSSAELMKADTDAWDRGNRWGEDSGAGRRKVPGFDVGSWNSPLPVSQEEPPRCLWGVFY